MPPKSVSVASSTINVEDIDTLTSLYASGTLEATHGDFLYNSNKSINDKIRVIKADITSLKASAIVNAANESLRGGGGVDGAIHRKAGPELLKACRLLNGCETGSAKITEGFELLADYVIHAVGPIYDKDEKEWCQDMLESCYQTSLDLAVQHECTSIVFSALSTGIYGYPSDLAAKVACETVRKYAEGSRGLGSVKRVVFCNFAQKDVNAYDQILPIVFPPVNTGQGKADENKVENVTNETSKKPDSSNTMSVTQDEASAQQNARNKLFPPFNENLSTKDFREFEVEDLEKGFEEGSEGGAISDPLEDRLPNAPTTEPNSDNQGGPDKKKQKMSRDIESAPVDETAEVPIEVDVPEPEPVTNLKE